VSYQGRNGLLQLWSALGESWDDYQFEIEELTGLEKHVLLVGRVRGRGSGSGVPIDQRVWVLWRFSGQRAVHAKSFASRNEALAADGLRDG
jgi:ketosteroid isomerase-like protein